MNNYFSPKFSVSEEVRSTAVSLSREKIDHEIFVTNDNSKDNTLQVLQVLQQQIPTLVFETNQGPNIVTGKQIGRAHV